MRYNLYRGDRRVYAGVTFNHAVGVLYRSQSFDPPRDLPMGRFDIERELRSGACAHPAFGGLYAISVDTDGLQRWTVLGRLGEPLTKPIARIQAEHCAESMNAAFAVDRFHVEPCYE